jgi:hypothetical protein
MDPPKRGPIAAQASRTEGLSLRDRLIASGRKRFVGRDAELALFRAALRAVEAPFAVLHVHGPGGIGKTTLLRELDREAQRCGRSVIRIDGRDLHPSPAGFRRALSEALHRDEGRDVAAPFSPNDVPVGAVLLIDTFEKIEVIGTWLREHFLPGLPARCLLVFAGRTSRRANGAPDRLGRADALMLSATLAKGRRCLLDRARYRRPPRSTRVHAWSSARSLAGGRRISRRGRSMRSSMYQGADRLLPATSRATGIARRSRSAQLRNTTEALPPRP